MKKLIRPTVGVIITTWNRPVELLNCVLSILNQSYPVNSILIIDDLSNTKLVETTYGNIKSASDRIEFIYPSEKKYSPAALRNIGIDKLRTDFIAFCDDDDLWHPEKLKCQLETLIRTDAFAAGTAIKTFRKENQLIRENQANTNFEWIDLNAILDNKNVPLSSLIVRNTPIRFKESTEFAFVEDWQFQIELALKHGSIVKLSSALTYYRLSSNSSYKPEHAKNAFNVIENNGSLYSKKKLKKAKARTCFQVAYRYNLMGSFLLSSDYCKRVVKDDKLNVKVYILLILNKLRLKIRT